MNNIQNNERWLTDGDCSKCRRHKYCSKACSANNRRVRRTVLNALDNATGNVVVANLF